MDTVAGQTFLNYAYSWGASIVILGALFKLTHLPGANVMLFIGMGTEVFVFFISAFDRPFDKTAEGREMLHKAGYGETMERENGKVEYSGVQTVDSTGSVESPARSVNGDADSVGAVTANHDNAPIVTETAAPQQPAYVPQMSQEEAEAMNEAQGNYVEELKTLVETLKKVNEQSMRLTRDSEEMENLNRTLTGISKVYEMQLKGASKQIGTIDEINAQTKKMAEQIEQLNRVYARMIEAMTVNMRAAAPHVNEE